MSGGRRLIVIGVAVLAVLVALRVAGELTRDDQRAQGPAGSSYAYGRYGASAYATLLQRSGHRGRARRAIGLRDLDLDPRLTVVAALARRDHARRCGRAAALRRARRQARGRGRAQPGAWLGGVVPDPPRWASEPLGVDARARAAARDRGRAHARARASRVASSTAGSAVPAVGERDGACWRPSRASGAGRAVLLADAAPLVNSRLARRDDAAFALAVAGPGRPVAFVESVHGYGRASGWGALPGRFRGALVLLGARRARRSCSRAGAASGPRSRGARARAARAPPTPRASPGALRALGPAGEAIAPVVEEARSLLLVPAGGGDDELLAAARARGAERGRGAGDRARRVRAVRPRSRRHAAWHASTSGGERR